MTIPHPLIKICSLREPGQAEFAVAAGADAVGLIFGEARRRVSVGQAAEIARELRRLDAGRRMLVVGVFVDQPSDEINRIATQVELDLVQLHGAEGPDVVARVERPTVKAIRPSPLDRASSILDTIAELEALDRPPVAYLVDGFSRTEPGGSGERADWVMAAALARSTRLILAGGLTPANVAQAITSVRPLGVDVSSGVETDGVKDREQVLSFVTAARATFAELELGESGIVPIADTAEPVHRP